MTLRAGRAVDSPGSRRHDGIVLALAGVAQFMVVLDVSVVNVAMPSIGRQLHYGPTGLQWVANAYVLTYAGFLLLGGRVADLVGRRRAYLAGLVLFVAASVAGGAAQTSGWLTAARAAQGLGSALLAPASLTIVVTAFSGRRLTKAIGIWSAIGSAGGAAGVVLGGVITAELGWRWILFVNVPMGVAAGAVALVFLPELRRADGERRLDVPGAVTVTAGLALLAYAIVETDRYAWLSAHTLGLVGGAAALLGVFLVIQLRSPRPLMPLRFFRSRWVTGANLIIMSVGAWSFAPWYFYSLYLQDVVGFSPLRTGVAFLPMTVIITVSAQVSSRILVPRLGVRRTVQIAALIGVVGFLWLSRMTATDGYWTGLFGGAMCTSMCQGLIFTPLASAATAGVDRSEAGLASGLLNTFRQVGGSIGLAALATVAATRTRELAHGAVPGGEDLASGYARGLFVIAFLVAGCVVLSFVFPRRVPPTVVKMAPPVPPGPDDIGAHLPAEEAPASGRTR